MRLLKWLIFFAIVFSLMDFKATSYAIIEDSPDIRAGGIVQYSDRIRRTVTAIALENKKDLNIISFEREAGDDYHNEKCLSARCHVFGDMDFQLPYWPFAPEEEFQDITIPNSHDWIFTGSVCIDGIGTGGADCHHDKLDNEELVAVLPFVKKELCEIINEDLKLLTTRKYIPFKKYIPIVDDKLNPNYLEKFTGSYLEKIQIKNIDDKTNIFAKSPYGCYAIKEKGNRYSYHFYRVLIER